MADIRVLYAGANSLYRIHSEASDSIKMASLKTANFELTDTKLGKLVDGNDASNEHLHDSRYYREDEHISASTGASDASKPVLTNVSGLIDLSFIDIASINHDQLAGLGDDDHTIYSLADGTRNYSAVVSYASHPTFNADTQIVDKKYVDDAVTGLSNNLTWLDPIKFVNVDSTLVSPVSGDRVLVNGTGLNAFAGHDNSIATWTGSAYTFEELASFADGSATVLINSDKIYIKVPAGWGEQQFEATTVEASGPLTLTGREIDLAVATNGGLKVVAQELTIEPADFAGDGLVDDGADNLAIDFATVFTIDGADAKAIKASDLASTGAGKGASVVAVRDLAGNFTGDNVEAVLAELAVSASAGNEFEATIATGETFAKGDLAYITGNGEVSKYDDLTVDSHVVGMALEAGSAGNTIKFCRINKVVTGVLSGATAGDEQFWTGAGFSTTMSITANENVYLAGVALNATDMVLEVRHIKKN